MLGVLFMYYVVLPRALDFLTSYDDNIYDIQIRASYYYSFAALTLLAGGLALPHADLRPRARATARPDAPTGCEATGASRTSLLLVFAILLPTVDPVSLAFEIDPAPHPLRDVDLARGPHGTALESRAGTTSSPKPVL